MKEVKFFDPQNPQNACIIDIEHYRIEEIVKLAKYQESIGRGEIKFLNTE